MNNLSCLECDKINNIMKGAHAATDLDSLGEIIECPLCKQKWILEMKQGNHYNPPRKGYWYCYTGYNKFTK